MNDRHEFYEFTPNDPTTCLQCYAVRDNSCNWCRYGFAYPAFHPRCAELRANAGSHECASARGVCESGCGTQQELFDASESVLVWSADSKSVAYGFSG